MIFSQVGKCLLTDKRVEFNRIKSLVYMEFFESPKTILMVSNRLKLSPEIVQDNLYDLEAIGHAAFTGINICSDSGRRASYYCSDIQSTKSYQAYIRKVKKGGPRFW